MGVQMLIFMRSSTAAMISNWLGKSLIFPPVVVPRKSQHNLAVREKTAGFFYGKRALVVFRSVRPGLS